MSEYDKQAEEFLKKTGTEFKAEFLENNKYFPDDDQTRDIYLITLKRGNREYKFKFGNSIIDSVKYIIYSKDGHKPFNDLKKAGQWFLKNDKMMLNRGHYKENIDFEEPTPYSVLASLTKYDPSTFEDFCSSYGYDTDSIKAEKVYKAVCDEWKNIQMLYNDEDIELLQEIN